PLTLHDALPISTMLGRAVNRVQTQGLITAVDYIVASTGRNDHCVVILDGMCLSVNHDLALAFFDAKELIMALMNLFPDFLTRLQRHQDQLQVFPRVKHLAVKIIVHGQFFDIIDKTFHTTYSIDRKS